MAELQTSQRQRTEQMKAVAALTRAGISQAAFGFWEIALSTRDRFSGGGRANGWNFRPRIVSEPRFYASGRESRASSTRWCRKA
jgi:hypothetical protein